MWSLWVFVCGCGSVCVWSTRVGKKNAIRFPHPPSPPCVFTHLAHSSSSYRIDWLHWLECGCMSVWNESHNKYECGVECVVWVCVVCLRTHPPHGQTYLLSGAKCWLALKMMMMMMHARDFDFFDFAFILCFSICESATLHYSSTCVCDSYGVRWSSYSSFCFTHKRDERIGIIEIEQRRDVFAHLFIYTMRSLGRTNLHISSTSSSTVH